MGTTRILDSALNAMKIAKHAQFILHDVIVALWDMGLFIMLVLKGAWTIVHLVKVLALLVKIRFLNLMEFVLVVINLVDHVMDLDLIIAANVLKGITKMRDFASLTVNNIV
jgi:hypothetical protein